MRKGETKINIVDRKQIYRVRFRSCSMWGSLIYSHSNQSDYSLRTFSLFTYIFFLVLQILPKCSRLSKLHEEGVELLFTFSLLLFLQRSPVSLLKRKLGPLSARVSSLYLFPLLKDGQSSILK